MNELARQGIPYLFVIDYEGSRALVEAEQDIDPNELLYSFNGVGNAEQLHRQPIGPIDWQIHPPTFEEYARSFNIVRKQLLDGNSYLVNLTCRVGLTTDLSLRDIFLCADAPYRLWLRNTLVCFSPEPFVRICHGEISSFPMKGTADATLLDAADRLMSNEKEAAEHATIVDLIRNDLSIVSDCVRVVRYRYLETLHTHKGPLLQTSSEIRGRLFPHLVHRPGDILFSQLPAGSITGAPKRKTVDIIADAETYRRDFYTGVMGRWSNGSLDSAVMIRFIDQTDGQFYFKAGGGITAKSLCRDEYQEIIDKVYVPIH